MFGITYQDRNRNRLRIVFLKYSVWEVVADGYWWFKGGGEAQE
jgi:hypothetical protein